MAGSRVAHATLKGPSVVKELCIGLALGLVAGGLWKMQHWNEQRKVRTFYDLLEKGEISVVAEENAAGYAIRIASEAIGVEHPIDELVTLKHFTKSAQRNILSWLSVSWSSDYGSSFLDC
ncbi:hypothetical protein LWI28_019646 [Acer negundo]|uniref:Cytochrome c oxidase subunit 5C n=1 Tax=Acer negundo TaxID=4023 RepID=A0AAD5IF28_ACENE|nr:hypothetical protein LWI28_019646 [Acer negundo]